MASSSPATAATTAPPRSLCEKRVRGISAAVLFIVFLGPLVWHGLREPTQDVCISNPPPAPFAPSHPSAPFRPSSLDTPPSPFASSSPSANAPAPSPAAPAPCPNTPAPSPNAPAPSSFQKLSSFIHKFSLPSSWQHLNERLLASTFCKALHQSLGAPPLPWALIAALYSPMYLAYKHPGDMAWRLLLWTFTGHNSYYVLMPAVMTVSSLFSPSYFRIPACIMLVSGVLYAMRRAKYPLLLALLALNAYFITARIQAKLATTQWCGSSLVDDVKALVLTSMDPVYLLTIVAIVDKASGVQLLAPQRYIDGVDGATYVTLHTLIFILTPVVRGIKLLVRRIVSGCKLSWRAASTFFKLVGRGYVSGCQLVWWAASAAAAAFKQLLPKLRSSLSLVMIGARGFRPARLREALAKGRRQAE